MSTALHNALWLVLASASVLVGCQELDYDRKRVEALERAASTFFAEIRSNQFVCAVRDRNIDCARMWLDAGVSPNSYINYEEEGDGPVLFEATRMGDETMTALLLERKADIFAPGNIYASGEQFSIVQLPPAAVETLLRARADVNACDGQQCSLLHMICKFPYLETLHILLAYGADVHAQDRDGYTPLVHAAVYRTQQDARGREVLVERARYDVVKSLLIAKASPCIKEIGGLSFNDWLIKEHTEVPFYLSRKSDRKKVREDIKRMQDAVRGKFSKVDRMNLLLTTPSVRLLTNGSPLHQSQRREHGLPRDKRAVHIQKAPLSRVTVGYAYKGDEKKSLH